ncbi:MAG: methyltransferase domain-containing protein [Candidatus Acidiferrum sp.]|jgi:trans-aconitate methyltransferase
MSVAQGSNWNAELYDDKHSFVWKMAAGLVDLLETKPGERILDLGCGTGHLTEQIADRGAKVVGVDKSPEMIQQARAKFPSLQFEVMDAREIVFAEPFDAVFSNATLHWIKEPERAVAGIAKALRSEGRFVAEFGGKGNVAGLLAATERAWHKLGPPGPAPSPWYYPSVGEYSTLLEKHSLEVTLANLFDRPTALEDGARGLHNWLEMFGGSFLDELPAGQREAALMAIEREARPTLFHDDHWVMDYRRLRVVARKVDGSTAT